MYNLKDYLSFNRRERNGVVVLLLILSGLIIFDRTMPAMGQDDVYDTSGFAAKVDSFYQWRKELKKTQKEKPVENEKEFPSQKHEVNPSPEYFEFNPNALGRKGWKKLGLASWQIDIILNYLNSGAEFRIKSDLKEVYGIDSTLYEKLKSYILLPERQSLPQKEIFDGKSEIIAEINLNSAEDSVLMKLTGIGPVLSKRIIKYRNLLGGYVHRRQLLEVYGIDSSLYSIVNTTFHIDTSTVERMDVNTLRAEELASHPYIDYKLARTIVNYRKDHGKFGKVSDLKNIFAINDSLLNQLKPYIFTSHVN